MITRRELLRRLANPAEYRRAPSLKRTLTQTGLMCFVLIHVGFGTGFVAATAAAPPDQADQQTTTTTMADSPDLQREKQAARIARLSVRYECSPVGLSDDQIPIHTVITGADDRVRLVSFDLGWAVHLGDEPGVLNAVCAL